MRSDRSVPHAISLFDAIRAAWSAETSAVPEAWSSSNPARGQCDVSSFVAWEHLGGSLVLGQVFVGGLQTEHHYWNRVDGHDVDLTRHQFPAGTEIHEVAELDADTIEAGRANMRAELVDRLAVFREAVAGQLAVAVTS